MVGILGTWGEACYLGIAALEGGLHDLQCSGKDDLVVLVHIEHLLNSAYCRGVTFCDILLFYMLGNSIASPLVAQGIAHILGRELTTP